MTSTHAIVCASLMLCATVQAQTRQQDVPAMKTPAAGQPAGGPATDAVVRRIDKAKGMLVLQHGDIPNLAMPPMTMGFDVADPKMLDRLKPGDKVRFHADVVNGKATVTAVQALR